MTTVESYTNQRYYVWLYLAKVCVVTLALVLCRDSWQDIIFNIRVVPLALLVGLLVFVLWVGLDKWIAYPHLSSRAGVNPFAVIESPGMRALFFVARFYGLVLMVPVMEELFWRSFLLRYLTDSDFKRLPQGSFSWSAFIWVAVAFAVSHPEWLAALVTAALYALLLRHTKSIFACVVAHLTTNLSLGIYILKTGEWGYW
jgi:CAAX prenyl protease-like protein